MTKKQKTVAVASLWFLVLVLQCVNLVRILIKCNENVYTYIAIVLLVALLITTVLFGYSIVKFTKRYSAESGYDDFMTEFRIVIKNFVKNFPTR